MKDEPLHRRKETAPTVIHDYDEDRTVLERWFRRGLEKGASFWLLVGGVVASLAIVMLLANTWANRRPPGMRAWTELMVPTSVPESSSEESKGLPASARPLMKLAEAFPETEAAHWALYQAASYLYQEGLRDLPNNRDAARPILNQSIELFDRVIGATETDDPLRRLAMMGKARALESRGELDEASAQYQEVASTWPDSEVASQAKERAERLETPEVKKFYEDFYAQDFSQFTSGPGLDSDLGLPPGHPLTDSPTDLGLPFALPPDLGIEPVEESVPSAPMPSTEPSTGLPELPPGLFAPGMTPSPEPSPEPQAEPTETTAPELPSEVFAPGGADSSPMPESSPEPEADELPNNPFAP